MEKKVLMCTGVAAASNVVLNLIWIPRYGATAAAVNTLAAYVVFLGALALAARHVLALAKQSAILEPEVTRQASGY